MAKKARKLLQKDAEKLMPAVKQFNGLASQFIKLLGIKVAQKEKKISVLVSRIAKPKETTERINVKTVDISTDFIRRQRKKAKKQGSSEWDEGFSQKRGYVI